MGIYASGGRVLAYSPAKINSGFSLRFPKLSNTTSLTKLFLRGELTVPGQDFKHSAVLCL